MSDPHFSFKANIRLKDIIGQGLINNSNIAIIELIKNAKDAGSENVELIFSQSQGEDASSSIVIRDSGSGMSLGDIQSKWLNIAYSEKRNGRKPGNTHFAGEKGIGRFSCDRLGRQLDLYTKRTGDKWAHLRVDWSEFEVDDPDRQISDVRLHPRSIPDKKAASVVGLDDRSSGTTLVISDLRQHWSEIDLRKLQKELERFVIDPKREFSIYFKSLDYVDDSGKLLFDGYIENKLLSKIDEKTIAIFSEICPEGRSVRNEIRHLGQTILSFEMDNPYDQLRDISVQIHYLSQSAKLAFKSITGYTSTEYGSIMLFHNGFRVMPYGEPKDDWLQLNERKNQGTSRHLGTRELFGLVDVRDSTRRFVPVSSREGMAHNVAFSQLTDDDLIDGRSSYAYLPTLVRTLEKYVVDGMDWDRISPENANFSYSDILASINAIVKASAKATPYRNVYVAEERLRAIARQKVEEVDQFVSELLEKVADKEVYELTKAERRDLKRYVERHQSTISARNEVAEAFKVEATQQSQRLNFVETSSTINNRRFDDVRQLIAVWSGRIENEIDQAIRVLRDPSQERAAGYRHLGNAQWLAGKIGKLSALSANPEVELGKDNVSTDVFSYVEGYLAGIRDLAEAENPGFQLKYANEDGTKLILNFSPLELPLLIDAVISRSLTTTAKTIAVTAFSDKTHHYLDIADDAPLILSAGEGVVSIDATSTASTYMHTVARNLDATGSIFRNLGGGTTFQLRWEK